jgi:hypothetical protein
MYVYAYVFVYLWMYIYIYIKNIYIYKYNFLTKNMPAVIGGHRHRSQCRRYPTSDIDICYSDIGDKYVGLKTSFRYRKCSDIDIRVHSDIRHWRKKKISPCRFEPAPLGMMSEHYNITLLWLLVQKWMSDIGYWIQLHSDIRYNVGLRSLSPISEVPISGSVRYRWSRISD